MTHMIATRSLLLGLCLSFGSYSFAGVEKQNVSNEPAVIGAEGGAKQGLMTRLAQTSHFTADFIQQVKDEENNLLQQSEGKLAVQKPNLVYWQTTAPEESLILSDGSNLWFYDPFIEQASVYDVNASIANTPILLLTSSDQTLWQQYQVSQVSADSYDIKSKDINSQVKLLTLHFSPDTSLLSGFSILDATGQRSVIELLDLDAKTTIEPSLFEFTPAEGVYIDDQR